MDVDVDVNEDAADDDDDVENVDDTDDPDDVDDVDAVAVALTSWNRLLDPPLLFLNTASLNSHILILLKYVWEGWLPNNQIM